jgi:hypothetical protein
MIPPSAKFRRHRQDLLAGTATELLVEMGLRIRAIQAALAADDESALETVRGALPLLRSAVDRLVGRDLDAASLATLSAAVRALPDGAPDHAHLPA